MARGVPEGLNTVFALRKGGGQGILMGLATVPAWQAVTANTDEDFPNPERGKSRKLKCSNQAGDSRRAVVRAVFQKRLFSTCGVVGCPLKLQTDSQDVHQIEIRLKRSFADCPVAESLFCRGAAQYQSRFNQERHVPVNQPLGTGE